MLMYSLLCYDMQSTLATYYQTQNTLPHERLCWKRFPLWSQQPWILHNKIRSQLAFSPLLSLKRFSAFKTFFEFFLFSFLFVCHLAPSKFQNQDLLQFLQLYTWNFSQISSPKLYTNTVSLKELPAGLLTLRWAHPEHMRSEISSIA